MNTGNLNTTYHSVLYKSSLNRNCIANTNKAGIFRNAIFCTGIRCESHSILSVNSAATKNLLKFAVYQGNPVISVHLWFAHGACN